MPSVVQVLIILGLIALLKVVSEVGEWFRVHFLVNTTLPKGPSTGGLIAGNLKEATQPDFHRVFENWTNQHGGIFHWRAAHIHGIVITDPYLMAEVLQSKEFDKEPRTYKALDSMLSDMGHQSILSGPTASAGWKSVRKGVMPAFSPQNIRHGFQHVVEINERLVGILKRGGSDKVADMDELFKREALDVIGQIGFGYDMGAVAEAANSKVDAGHSLEVADAAATEVERRWAEPFRGYKFWKEGVRKGKADQSRYHSLMRKLLADVKRRAVSGQLLSSSVAGHLLNVRDPHTGKPLSDDRLLPEVATFFFAGEDTTSHTASWTLYCVSQNPSIEAKIVEELDSLGLLAKPGSPQPRALQYDDLSKLTYLNMVIKEAERMYPVAGGTVRAPKKDVMLAGKYIIPARTTVFLPAHAIHNTWRNFEEPDRFLPERWQAPGAEYARPLKGGELAPTSGDVANGSAAPDLNGHAEEKSPSAKLLPSPPSTGGKAKRFLPFMEGARSCAGQALAVMNLTATLAMMYGSFTFRLAAEMGGPEGVRAAEHLSITMSCDKGMKMHVNSRV
ncbi:hypothetical protein CVIRNUC_004867 [Coccomyxa viridis]|uniref:Cytochrome P450 n=1 Tax=Coccomyxa viridis TaxID=1274662 RepID=A0AAV1I3Q1_9CHLO|nr:hypothetical protein CVIRNUC_004867 [Coccomyxa viridis]